MYICMYLYVHMARNLNLRREAMNITYSYDKYISIYIYKRGGTTCHSTCTVVVSYTTGPLEKCVDEKSHQSKYEP